METLYRNAVGITALKSGYGNFLLWSCFSGLVVETFTSSTMVDVITDLTIHWISVCTVMI